MNNFFLKKQAVLFFQLVIIFNFIKADDWKKKLLERINSRVVDEWISKQIRDDLKEFYLTGISKEILDSTCKGNFSFDSKKEHFSMYLFRFKIKNNLIYLDSSDFEIKNKEIVEKITANKDLLNKLFYPWIYIFPKLLLNMLYDLTNTITLPDVDFIFYSHDGYWPPEHIGPIFAITKPKNSQKIIAIPDFLSYELSKKIDDIVKFGNLNYPWQKKITKSFWRGSPSDIAIKPYCNSPRFKIVKKSFERPDLIDARFTSIPKNVDLKIPLNYLGNFVSMEDHLMYKYQILVDGSAAPCPRILWQLATNSVVLKQESESIQWYYNALIPYVHYIPFKNDISDLVEKIEWAKNNDFICEEIARNANEFSNNNLKKADFLYYFYILFREYSKLQRFEVEI